MRCIPGTMESISPWGWAARRSDFDTVAFGNAVVSNVIGNLDRAVALELLARVGAVSDDSGLPDAELCPSLGVAVATRDEARDLTLALGEIVPQEVHRHLREHQVPRCDGLDST